MRSRSCFHWLPCILILFFALAQAGVVTQSSDKASFDAAAGSVLVDTFGTDPHYNCGGIGAPINSTSVLPCSFMGSPIYPGLIQPGVTYSAIDMSGLINFDVNILSGYAHNPVLSILSTGQGIIAEFTHPVSAVGFLALTAYAHDVTATFSFAGGGTQTIGPLSISGASTFFGFTSPASDIRKVTLTNSLGKLFVDNFTFSAPSAVPEPALFAPVGLAVAALYLRRRRSAR